MTKKLAIVLTLALLILTACVPSVEKQLEKAAQLVKERDYNEAIEIYEKILDEDETMYEAWDGLVKAYIKDDEYRDADKALEEFFEVIKDNYEQDDEVDYDDWLDEINDYANDILDEDEEVGDWFNELNPPTINLMDLAYDHDIESPIVLDVPKGMDVYYTLDGSKPDKRDDKYGDGIKIDEEGEYILTVVAVNDFGIEGDESFTYVYVYAMPEAPVVNVDEGTYDNEVTLYVENYNYETMDLYYTLDGTDPQTNGYYYYEEDGIRLHNGDYEVRISYYDYDTGYYSKETVLNYNINNPNAVTEYTEFKVALFDVDYNTYNEVEYALYDIYTYEENIDVIVYEVYDLDTLMTDLESGYADAFYSHSMYVEDLAGLGLLADAEDIITFSDYDYYNLASDAGYYDGDYYTLPVTIDPDMQLYANTFDLYEPQVETWEQMIEAANSGYSSYNFLYPEDIGGYWLYSFYLGYGGYYQFDEKGNFVIDRQPLIDALQFTYDLPVTYFLGYEGMDYDTYISSIENGDATLVLSNPWFINTYDYSENYMPLGPMPLPNGEYAASVNNVYGLHVNSMIAGDENKMKVSRVVYKYLAEDYYANYIASYTDGLPAIKSSLNADYLWLSGDVEDYEFAIDYNITVPYTYQLENVYEVMGYYMYEVFYNEMSIEEAADIIIEEVASYY